MCRLGSSIKNRRGQKVMRIHMYIVIYIYMYICITIYILILITFFSFSPTCTSSIVPRLPSFLNKTSWQKWLTKILKSNQMKALLLI